MSMIEQDAKDRMPAPSMLDSMLSVAQSGKLDADSIERMFALWERQQASEARAAFAAALAAFQAECPTVAANRENAHLRSKYATLEHIVAVTRELRARHGLSFSFDTQTEGERMTVTCIVRHAAGHAEHTMYSLPVAAANKGVNAQQASGSALTYAKRYALCAALGIMTGEETHDDDGIAAGAATVTEDQAATIVALAEEVNVPLPRVCDLMNVDAIEDIPAARYRSVIRSLEKKR